ncbi:hypothetical protein [Janthinobacterium sp.]|uniref:hypothetical protein n=1 Tax=Janthinobacterium sp. TaxID=1871054 RepID=UPI00258EC3E5|nr:hypothetical protein [Janthinobacterium sp.]MCX7293696.1 hypothetical protein [Janthinobacterium sp.]
MKFDTSIDAYIARIKERLSELSPESALYAALELRCAVEGKMKEYLEPLAHIPKSQKKEWSVLKLGKSIDNAFTIKDKIASFTICFENPIVEIELQYRPVSSRLQEIAKRVGDYLHFPNEKEVGREDWIKELQDLVQEGVLWLEFAEGGDLYGMPLINTKTKQTDVRVKLSGDDPHHELLKRMKTGEVHQLKVDYLPLPKMGRGIE